MCVCNALIVLVAVDKSSVPTFPEKSIGATKNKLYNIYICNALIVLMAVDKSIVFTSYGNRIAGHCERTVNIQKKTKYEMC